MISGWKSKIIESFNPALACALMEAERVRTLLAQPNSKSAFILSDMIANAAKDAYLKRKPVVWITPIVPSEIVLAAKAVPICPEVIGSSLAWLGLQSTCLLEADKLPVSSFMCAYHRSAIGAIPLNLLPTPDALVCATDVCDANLNAFRDIASRYDRPLFVLDVPSDRDKTSLSYIAFQLGQLVEFLTEHVRRPFGREGLAEAVEWSNAARSAFVKLNELRKVVALPRGVSIDLNSLSVHFGRDKLAAYLESLCWEISQKPKVAGRPRLLWLSVKPQPSESMLDRVEARGASIVFEEVNEIYWPELDASCPLSSLAAKISSHHNCAPLHERIERLIALASDHQVDGVVSIAYFGCRNGGTALPYILQGLADAGIPSISLEDDFVGPRDSEGRTSLDDFIETLNGAA